MKASCILEINHVVVIYYLFDILLRYSHSHLLEELCTEALVEPCYVAAIPAMFLSGFKVMLVSQNELGSILEVLPSLAEFANEATLGWEFSLLEAFKI